MPSVHIQGEQAHRVWNLIYSQSCFMDVMQPDVCTERKVFYRLISGERSPLRQDMPCFDPNSSLALSRHHWTRYASHPHCP